MLRAFEQTTQFALGEYMSVHRPNQILAVRASRKIKHLVQRKNFEMIVMRWITLWRTRSFVSDATGGRVRALP